MNVAHTFIGFRRLGSSFIQTIQPVNVLPKDSPGALCFSSDNDPATGRAANQGNCCFICISEKLKIFAMKGSKV